MLLRQSSLRQSSTPQYHRPVSPQHRIPSTSVGSTGTSPQHAQPVSTASGRLFPQSIEKSRQLDGLENHGRTLLSCAFTAARSIPRSPHRRVRLPLEPRARRRGALRKSNRAAAAAAGQSAGGSGAVTRTRTS